MDESHRETEALLNWVAHGDREAIARLLEGYRSQLGRMVACQLDDRLAARVDASDVVQETLIVAAAALPQYAHERPLPFSAWLRSLAAQRLVDLRRRHLVAQRRSVLREQPLVGVHDTALQQLAEHLSIAGPGPPSEAWQQERAARVRQAVQSLAPVQRDVLLLHYLKHLNLTETAAALGITPRAARMRHLRALQRLRAVLESDWGNS